MTDSFRQFRKALKKGQPKTFDNSPAFSDVLSQTLDEVENSFSMLIYEHPTNLSPEQVLFALEFINNGYKAVTAIRDTFGKTAKKWTNAKCESVARRLLKLEKVRSFIDEQLRLRAEKLQVTADWVALKYKTWAELNITDYLEIVTGARGRQTIKLKCSVDKLPDHIKSGIKGVKMTAAGDLNVEFIDQKSALDSLCKVLGIGADKPTDNNSAPVVINIDSQDAEA